MKITSNSYVGVSIPSLGLAIALLLACLSARGMTFDVVMMNGEPAILGRGEIILGDASRLKAALTPKARHSYGYFTLVLESPGGSVQAAFDLSKVIDSSYVNTYVAPNGKCLSACAAIVFIAGREHVAVPGSHLGFHGCYNKQTGNIETLCNEAIAEHAFAHGTSYGAVMAWIEKIPSDEIVWISGREADCWGINRYVISPSPEGYSKCVLNILRNIPK